MKIGRSVIVAITLVLFGIGAWIWNARVIYTKEQEALQEVSVIGQALRLFENSEKRYPLKLSELVGKYIESKSALVDPWGNAFICKVSNDKEIPSVKIYSIGPNGIDEMGSGDDLLMSIP
jgi:hypothetical protein